MCWAGGRNTRPLSAIWSSGSLSQNLYKNNYKEITKNYCKNPSKELQYGYRKGDALLDHEIFFFLFLEYRVSAILLRLFSFTAVGTVPHRRYLASCAKKSVRFSGADFFALQFVSENRPVRRKSMTLHVFGGQFYCFSAKDSSKVCCHWGLYSDGVCGKV